MASEPKPCAVPGCFRPRRLRDDGSQSSYCAEHWTIKTAESNRKRRSTRDEAEMNRRAALGLLMDIYPNAADISSARPHPHRPTVPPATAKSLVLRGLAAMNPEHTRVWITPDGRSAWLALMAEPPARDLRSDPDYVPPSSDDVHDISTLAEAARHLPPLPDPEPLELLPPVGDDWRAPKSSRLALAEELALLAELKSALAQVGVERIAREGAGAPLVAVLQRIAEAQL